MNLFRLFLLVVGCAGILQSCGGGGGDGSGADTTAPVMVSLKASQPLGGRVTLTAVATDNLAVTGYCFTDSSTKPAKDATCFQRQSQLTLPLAVPSTPYYVWARDASGNVSESALTGPCSSAAYVASGTVSGHAVCMLTSAGEMVVALESAKAPNTTSNFLYYVNSGFYSGTVFHRVLANFMAQGGGYTYANGSLATKAPTANPITLESTNFTGLSNSAVTLAMARTSAPNSATSQFFINLVDNASLDASRSPDGYGYSVFGRVIYGTTSALQAIRNTPVGLSTVVPGEQSQPHQPPVVLWAYQLK